MFGYEINKYIFIKRNVACSVYTWAWGKLLMLSSI